MKQAIKKMLAYAAAFGAAVAGLCALPSASAEAASFKDVNDPSVFLKQQERDTCTLCANVMMLRRTALMRGDADWNSITEYSAKPTVWCWGAGMYNSYSYKGINVSYGRIQGNAEAELIALLKEHPEGIAAYDYDHPHAILLTDYTNGVFYCADPANSAAAGRIPADQAIVSVSGMEAYWYVTSPDVQLTAPEPEKLRNKSYLNKKQIIAGESVEIKAGASGGAGSYKYSFYTRKAGASSWNTLKERTGTASISFCPAEYGSYEVYVIVEDGTGNSVNKCLSLTVNKPLINEASVSSSKVLIGSSLSVKGKASGGTGKYEYAYYYKKSASSKWITLKPYGTETSAVFKPRTEGKYELLVKVRDAGGSIAKKTFTVTASENKVRNNSTVSASQIQKGQTVILRGAASGGSGKYQFAYYFRKKGIQTWAAIKKYSSDLSASFTPLGAEEYELMIKAKDTEGKTDKKTFVLNVVKSLRNNSTVSSSNIAKGTAAVIRGKAEGGSGEYQYAFYCMKPISSQWTLLRDYKPSSSIVCSSREVGTLRIKVLVKDSEGTVAQKIISIDVK